MKSRSEGEKINNSACFLSYITKVIGYKSSRLREKYKKLYSLEELSLNTTEKEMEKVNLIADESSNIEDIIFIHGFQELNNVFENKKLIKSIEKLTQNQRNVIYELYVNDISERELAEKLNTSFQNINKVKKAALKNLNKSLLDANVYLHN